MKSLRHVKGMKDVAYNTKKKQKKWENMENDQGNNGQMTTGIAYKLRVYHRKRWVQRRCGIIGSVPEA